MGVVVYWLCDNFGLIKMASDIESFVGIVEDVVGVLFVFVFSGFFVLRWCEDVCGVIVGLM